MTFRNQTLLATLLASATLLAACGASSLEYAAQGEPIAPEVEMEIEFARASTSTGQYPLTVQLEELPRPSDIGEGVQAYVAWAQEPGSEAPRMLGVLRYDQDAQFGEVGASTTHTELTIFVTAEESREPSAPSDRVIVRREIVHHPG